MGLDFQGAKAHWAYSGFNRFRHRLAEAIGIDLDKMEGFGGEIAWSTVKDDLVFLLNHSDCDGQMSAKRCARIAVRLRAVVEAWPAADFDRRQALLLADGMEGCWRKRKPLIFC